MSKWLLIQVAKVLGFKKHQLSWRINSRYIIAFEDVRLRKKDDKWRESLLSLTKEEEG